MMKRMIKIISILLLIFHGISYGALIERNTDNLPENITFEDADNRLNEQIAGDDNLHTTEMFVEMNTIHSDIFNKIINSTKILTDKEYIILERTVVLSANQSPQIMKIMIFLSAMGYVPTYEIIEVSNNSYDIKAKYIYLPDSSDFCEFTLKLSEIPENLEIENYKHLKSVEMNFDNSKEFQLANFGQKMLEDNELNELLIRLIDTTGLRVLFLGF